MPNEQNIIIEHADLLAASPSEQLFLSPNQKQLAWQDIKDGCTKWRIWLMLAYQDIKLRYLRSVLGPFWITLSMAITVYTMGFLYAHLFHIEMAHYYPFLVAGMLTWALISSMITELTDTFMTSSGLIKQIKLPYTLYVHRIIMRNIIIFLHNAAVIIPIFIIYHDTIKLNAATLFIIPGMLLLYLNALVYGLILAMFGSRYRDVPQIIKSLIQVVFFVTPIMWTPEILPPTKQIYVFLNPIYSYVELIRAPLLGTLPPLVSIGITVLFTIMGAFIAFSLFARSRTRIIYWL